jgi:hypothetical protein
MSLPQYRKGRGNEIRRDRNIVSACGVGRRSEDSNCSIFYSTIRKDALQ